MTSATSKLWARAMDGRQEQRIRRVMKRLGQGWAIDPYGHDGLQGECCQFSVSARVDTRKPFIISRGDMSEMLNRGLIHKDQKGTGEYTLAPGGEVYLRVVK